MQFTKLTKLVGALSTLSLAAGLFSQSAHATDLKFGEFPAPPYKGPVSAPDLGSHPDARTYRSRIRRAAKGKVNFAGKYILTKWGRGASCLHGALQDAGTGRVFSLPHTICCWFDMSDDLEPIEFRPNRSLIIFRGLRDEEDPMGTHYYEFAENEFWLLKTEKFSPGTAAPVAGDDPSGGTRIVRNVPGGMQLLPGYKHLPLQGIDGVIGRIERTAVCRYPMKSATFRRRANPGLAAAFQIGQNWAPAMRRTGTGNRRSMDSPFTLLSAKMTSCWFPIRTAA